MGNHYSSSQGKYDFPERKRNCFTEGSNIDISISSDPVGGNDDSIGVLRAKTFRSQSVKHELRCSQKNKHSSFLGKGRRSNTIDNFPVQSFRGGSKKIKKLSIRRHSSYYDNNSNSACLQIPSTEELLKSPDPFTSKSSIFLSEDQENNTEVPWSPSIVKVAEESKKEQVSRMSVNLDKFAKQLVTLSKSELSKSSKNGENTISRSIFHKYVVPDSQIAEEYLWDFFMGFNDKSTCTNLKSSALVQGAEKIYTPITDKDQINFYVKIFGKGKDVIERGAFIDLLIASYQLSSTHASQAGRDLNNGLDFDGSEWISSVATSCFHIKETMSVFFVSNWILTNLPRLLIPMHKYIVHKLTTGYSRAAKPSDSSTPTKETQANKADNGVEKSPSGSEGIVVENNTPELPGLHPILMWLLFASLPSTYLAAFKSSPEEEKQQQMKLLTRINSKDLLLQLLNNNVESHKWTLLYDSANQGLSVNRFQYHVFNYRGPTLMFVKCENDYTFLVGIDTEWKENCHFWGGEQCLLIQLQPEYRVVEMGGKSLYSNFSIRGYPFGIQVGKDPRNISLEIKPDFEYAAFKKIPCRIVSLMVWGCAKAETKSAQCDHKKWEAKQSEKQKKINLSNVDWGDNPDKYLLELGGKYKSYGS